MFARMTHRTREARRGVLALTFAMVMLLLFFITVSAFLLSILTGTVRAENAARELQALYAAEAGIDLAIQMGGRQDLTGRCGGARYAVQRTANEIAAMGQVARPAGAPIRCVVVVHVRAGGALETGSWRQVPPATRPHLAGMLAGEAGEDG